MLWKIISDPFYSAHAHLSNKLFSSEHIFQLFRQPLHELPAVLRRLDDPAGDPAAGVARRPREVVLPRVDDERPAHDVLGGVKLGPNSMHDIISQSYCAKIDTCLTCMYRATHQ